MKLSDPERHRKYTGAPNHLIKRNFEYLAAKTNSVLIRLPLIPGLTDAAENVKAIAEYVRSVRAYPIELMNFNPLAVNKRKLAGLDCGLLEGMRPLPDSAVDRLRDAIEAAGCAALRNKS